MRNLIAIFILTIAAVSCGTISIKSTPPNADVSIILPGKESLKPLGKTPLELEMSKVEEAVDEGSIVIVVGKEGYLPQRFIMPNLSGGNLEIETNLKPLFASNYAEVNNIVAKVLSAERLVLEKRLDEALKVVQEIKTKNENIALAFELEGSIQFLKNDFGASRNAWLRAVELDPNNPESRSMLTLVEKKLGVAPTNPAASSPASAAPPAGGG